MKIEAITSSEIKNLEKIIRKLGTTYSLRYRTINTKDINAYISHQIKIALQDKKNIFLTAKINNKVRGIISLLFLPWDTKHFGFKMAKIEHFFSIGDYSTSLKIKSELLSELIQIAKMKKIKHISCRIDIENLSGIHILEKYGFKMMDSVVTYIFFSRKHTFHPLKTIYPVRLPKEVDLPYLRMLAKNAFKNSRFHLDPFFSKHKANTLYEKWVINSFLSHPFYVAIKEEIPIGFITYEIYDKFYNFTNFKVAGRGLIAADPRAKGAAIGLIQRVLNEAFLKYDALEITTRACNYEMIKIIQKFNLTLCKTQFTYHKVIQ